MCVLNDRKFDEMREGTIKHAKRVDDIDWANWMPTDEATLLFVIRNERILLIKKKRGLGAGNVNGPGGHVDRGESIMDGAIREVQEELCVTAVDVRFVGELQFQFKNGYSIAVHVFTADNCQGEPKETDEAIPLWVDVDQIPYDQMGIADQFWVPLMLTQKMFRGHFLFNGEHLLDYRVYESAS